MSHNDPSARRILPQNEQGQQASQMTSFSYAPQQFPQRETQKNYVFVDEHNRHKRLKVMRACEGCRRRKIKCDAATTNTWPCSACIRLKLHCVKPNGFDGSVDGGYEPPPQQGGQFHQMQMQQPLDDALKSGSSMFPSQDGYPDEYAGTYAGLPFDTAQQSGLTYSTVPDQGSLGDQNYLSQGTHGHPSPPSHTGPRIDESSPEAYSPDSYQQQDLADLLGTLKMDPVGTAPYLRNKASFRREETPAVEDDDDFESVLPSIPMTPGRGMKIRIPPALMPDKENATHYFELYFAHVHPYVPVLDVSLFYRQWHTNPETISPLILEAIFAIGGRLAEDPGEGQQWLALASRHADHFMDVPRLSTLQALLMMLKAREAAPKRGYYYRSWMTVVNCVQMGKDLGLDEHLEDHEAGRTCDFSPAECQLRTRIWKTVFVCETMVGTPQGRYDLSVDMDTVDFEPPQPDAGLDDGEYQVSRNFTYFSRVVRNIRKLTQVYLRLRKKKDWGTDPEFQKLTADFNAFLPDLPTDLRVPLPPDGSSPWLPSAFLGNLTAYHYLSLILFHRPILMFLDPNGADGLWKHHMMICYDSARALCRLQESVIDMFGLTGLQCMQRGFSFTVYAGLSCIVLDLVAIISPDPDLNSDAREYFTRHMRVMEQVMEVWQMQELRNQINAVREAFSADTRKPFVLKPSFPYGSPHPSNSSRSPQDVPNYQAPVERGAMMNHQQQRNLDTQGHQPVSFVQHPITPPASTSTTGSHNDVSSAQSLGLMPGGSQGPAMVSAVSVPDNTAWNPTKIFEQWNMSFGPGTQVDAESPNSLSISPSVPTQMGSLQDLQPNHTVIPPASQPMQQQFAAPQMQNFITPAMWQQSVASVYEGGLKRPWGDFQDGPMMKRVYHPQ